MSLLTDAAKMIGQYDVLFPELAELEERQRLERTHAEDMAALKSPAPLPLPANPRKAGRPPLATTPRMFQALGAVLARSNYVHTHLEDPTKHEEIIEAVFCEFYSRSDAGEPSSEYRKALKAFLDEYVNT